jgi:hypothetical protein
MRQVRSCRILLGGREVGSTVTGSAEKSSIQVDDSIHALYKQHPSTALTVETVEMHRLLGGIGL